MNASKRIAVSAVTSVVLILLVGQSIAQNSGRNIFTKVDALMDAATAAEAPLLAPKNYEGAAKLYAKAKGYDSEGRADKAQKELTKAEPLLNAAIEASKLGKVTFSRTLKTRDLALDAEAPKYEAELWQKAEDQFEKAARTLESGNVNSATERSTKARQYYGDAELAAIKTAIVGKARELIAAADDDRVSREAPITLNNAKALVAQAEADLDKSRYATSEPIALAASAEYEAKHAAYIASQVRRVDDREMTTEELILDWEQPVLAVARALDVNTDLSSGYEKSSAASVAMANSLTSKNAELEAVVVALETRLGGTELIVEETQRLQRQLAAVENLFGPNQARVVRVRDDLVLRLVGLSFPSGQSVIETRYFGLLKKVQEAIAIFPDAPIVIEGHTDAVGSDAVNMKLSQDRANSVREYLIANLGLPESRVRAVGMGKNEPIASNETAEGRAQNRRIDVVVQGVRARINN